MEDYNVVIATSARRELDENVPFPWKRQLNHRVVALKRNPRPRFSVHDQETGFYAIAAGDWTVEYAVDDAKKTVSVLRFVKVFYD